MIKPKAASTLAGIMPRMMSPRMIMTSKMARFTTTEAKRAMMVATWNLGLEGSSGSSTKARAASATGSRILEALPDRKAK